MRQGREANAFQVSYRSHQLMETFGEPSPNPAEACFLEAGFPNTLKAMTLDAGQILQTDMVSQDS